MKHSENIREYRKKLTVHNRVFFFNIIYIYFTAYTMYTPTLLYCLHNVYSFIELHLKKNLTARERCKSYPLLVFLHYVLLQVTHLLLFCYCSNIFNAHSKNYTKLL